MQTTMDELRDIRHIKLRMEKNYERIAWLREVAGMASSRMRQCASRGTSETDVMAEQVAKLVDLTNDYIADTVDMEMRVRDVIGTVDALPGEQSTIMRLRYIEGWEWGKIAKHEHLSPRRCFDVHAAAVMELGG